MPDFSREEVERVAKGLTRAQRERVFSSRTQPNGCFIRGIGPTGHSLRKLGLCVIFDLADDRLTPLGLAVRQHLIGTGEGGRE